MTRKIYAHFVVLLLIGAVLYVGSDDFSKPGGAAAGGSGDITDVGTCTTGACTPVLGTDTDGNYAGSSSEGGAATTATALAANPADCAANQFANTIAASGALTCAAIADADVPNTITVDLATVATTANAGDSATAFFSTGFIEATRGGVAAPASDGLGFFLSPLGTIPMVTPVSAAVLAGANNTACFQVNFRDRLLIGHITFQIATASAGGLIGLGLYDSAGTKLVETGAQSTTSTGVFRVDNADVTVNPGVYFACWTADNTTVRLQGLSISTEAIDLLNAGSVDRVGAASAGAAGVLPTPMGSITGNNSTRNSPMILFEP